MFFSKKSKPLTSEEKIKLEEKKIIKQVNHVNTINELNLLFRKIGPSPAFETALEKLDLKRFKKLFKGDAASKGDNLTIFLNTLAQNDWILFVNSLDSHWLKKLYDANSDFTDKVNAAIKVDGQNEFNFLSPSQKKIKHAYVSYFKRLGIEAQKENKPIARSVTYSI